MDYRLATPLALLTLVLAVGAFADTSEKGSVGAVDLFERDGNFGTLTRAASGVPRAVPSPLLEAIDRWRASAEAFAHGFVASRGANGTEQFATRRVYEDQIGEAHVRLAQSIAGLPVVGAEIIVHADSASGKVRGVNGRFAVDRGLARSPRMTANDAVAAAMSADGLATARVAGAPELTYIIDQRNAVRLAWTTLIAYRSANGDEVDRVYADAVTGAAVARHPQIRRAKNREIYDCLNQSLWSSCVFMFGEGGSSADQKAMAAYNNAGVAYDYFSSKHGRDGLNDGGIVLRQGINFGLDNACCGGWSPAGTYTAIVYNDAQGSYSAPEAYSLDIVAHEYTHGVVHFEGNLPHTGEQGAIDEGLADIFAVAVDAHRDGSADWWIAEDVYSASVSGDALRYLDDPARRTGQADYYPARSFGSVHENAGISGLAFYLLSQGGPHPRRSSISVTGVGIEKAERIFYRALVAYTTSSTDFRDLSLYTSWAATDLYGSGSEFQSVHDAWSAVGNQWQKHYVVVPVPAGTVWYSTPYTSVTTAVHTGQLTSSTSGANFDLFLEKWNGTSWETRSSSTSPGSTELVEAYVSAGMFRWRVRATGGSGTYAFDWNRPQ